MITIGGDADEEVAWFIGLHRLCKEYNHLPGSGGILDQDSYLMWGLQGVIEAIDIRQKMEEDQQKAKAAHAPR